MYGRNVSLVLLASLAGVTGATAQQPELEEGLRSLEPLIGTTWRGRVEQRRDAERMDLVWERVLDGKAVRLTRQVPAVGLVAEVLYFWDRERNALAFLGVSSRGVVQRGVVTVESGVIVHLGTQIGPETRTEYKQTLELLPDGRLRDVFYALTPSGWRQRHLILHETDPPGSR